MAYGGAKVGTHSGTFNGVNSYIDAGNITLDSSNWSIAAWTYRTTTSYARLVAYHDAGPTLWFDQTSSKFGLVHSGTIDWQPNCASPSAAWCHVVLTRAGTTAKIYKDGVLADTKTDLSVTFTATGVVRIGARPSGGEVWSSALDQVCIWNRAITADEVTTLNAGGLGIAYPFT